MISTKNIVSSLSEVPHEWVFEHYLNLSEQLTGQDVKMNSIFSSKDKFPSMFVYYDVNSMSYKYKDFSSGYQGDAIDLVQKLLSLPNRGFTSVKILEDYTDYLTHNNYKPIKAYKPHGKYKVVDYLMRHWTNLDKKYWTAFGIDSKMLEIYNVVPLTHYKMTKENQNGLLTSIVIKSNHLYGYFMKDGSLYKIYQPKVEAKKFIKVRDYIQGSEQLTFETKYLIINSSLKDLLGFNSLNIKNIESVAPDSENTMINKATIEKYKKKYTKVLVLFDNDEPGKKAMEKYKDLHSITPVIFELEKDLSDSIKKYGIEVTRDALIPILVNSIKN